MPLFCRWRYKHGQAFDISEVEAWLSRALRDAPDGLGERRRSEIVEEEPRRETVADRNACSGLSEVGARQFVRHLCDLTYVADDGEKQVTSLHLGAPIGVGDCRMYAK